MYQALDSTGIKHKTISLLFMYQALELTGGTTVVCQYYRAINNH